jgi:hypothetical protein
MEFRQILTEIQLSNVKKGDNIVFLTLVTQILLLTAKIITVSLGEDANLLNEVVIQVGYGTVKKKDLTGAVTVLTSEDFNKGPVTSADQMITGKVAGLQVINGGGSGEVLLLELEAVLHCLLIMTLYMSLIMFQLRPVVSTAEEIH